MEVPSCPKKLSYKYFNNELFRKKFIEMCVEGLYDISYNIEIVSNSLELFRLYVSKYSPKQILNIILISDYSLYGMFHDIEHLIPVKTIYNIYCIEDIKYVSKYIPIEKNTFIHNWELFSEYRHRYNLFEFLEYDAFIFLDLPIDKYTKDCIIDYLYNGDPLCRNAIIKYIIKKNIQDDFVPQYNMKDLKKIIPYVSTENLIEYLKREINNHEFVDYYKFRFILYIVFERNNNI